MKNNKPKRRSNVKRKSLKNKITALKNEADKKELRAQERRVSQNKVQELFTKFLLKNGTVDIVLPDGIKVQFGILQEGEDGKLIKVDDYAWMIASHKDKTIYMNSYDYGLYFEEGSNKVVLEDTGTDPNGKSIKIISVV